MDKLDLSVKSLRKFATIMGVACTVITVVIFFRHKHSVVPSSVAGLLFFAVGIIAPVLLKPLYVVWMRFAFVLGWVNTRIILCILFYLILTPIGIVLRIFGVDLLERRIEKKAGSYWHTKDAADKDMASYERQY